MDAIRKIYEQAQAIGQCGLFKGTETFEDLVALFRSPQGQEFCEKYDFPNLKTWREIARAYDLTRFGIYVDAGRISLSNKPHVTLVGNTTGECLRYDELKRHEVVLMHGARANIVAEKWAVVFVCKDRSSSYTKEQKDYSIIR
jgi:hypothetical protein